MLTRRCAVKDVTAVVLKTPWLSVAFGAEIAQRSAVKRRENVNFTSHDASVYSFRRPKFQSLIVNIVEAQDHLRDDT
ncbi:hypothetical protein, partial [Bartonella sp. CL43QHWL]|uniref:hypothetical protein n=1 Tax=Bartonella sp. CL43QHWL TaxID=3243532 RepID=UPI0035CEA42C